MTDWIPISEMPDKLKVSTFQFLLCHEASGWIRFGRYYQTQREWYYSATNERNQWAQTAGDAPTHWQHMPAIPGREALSEKYLAQLAASS